MPEVGKSTGHRGVTHGVTPSCSSCDPRSSTQQALRLCSPSICTLQFHFSHKGNKIFPFCRKGVKHRDLSLEPPELHTCYTSGNEAPKSLAFLKIPLKMGNQGADDQRSRVHLPSTLSLSLSCRSVPRPSRLCSSSPCWVLFMCHGWQFASCSFYYTFSSKYKADDTTRSEMLLVSPKNIRSIFFMRS